MLTIEEIKQAVNDLAMRYDVAKVDLFGSYANGTATEMSDADFLVTFNVEVPSIFRVMGFQEELKNALNRPVDVVTIPHTLNIDKVVSIYDRAG